jgi:DNA-binding CsgD family transcriptional regulator
MTAGAEPSTSPGWGLFAEWHALIDRGDPRFREEGSVDDALEVIARLATTLRASVWNMQRHSNIDSLRDEGGHEARIRQRGVEFRYVLPRRVAEQRNPLASSHFDYLRLAPVAHPLLVGDHRVIVVGDATGDAIWTSRDPDVVARAVDLFERVWAAAEPAVPLGEEPPFTPRMVAIGLRLADGATDRHIARELGVSERTVSADVREMSRRLGARNRAHAIALISGVEG